MEGKNLLINPTGPPMRKNLSIMHFDPSRQMALGAMS